MRRRHGESISFLVDESTVSDLNIISPSVDTSSFESNELTATENQQPAVERMFRFGRMFQDNDPEGLIELGLAMQDNQPDGVNNNPNLPAGYTYLGQFIDHDITFDKTEPFSTNELSLEDIKNGRSPSLDLDSLYGMGPKLDRKKLYEDDNVHFRIGSTAKVGDIDEFPNDLPRGDDPSNLKLASIGDERNDENLVVAQTHLAFLKFHNYVVDRLAGNGLSGDAIFEEARKKVVQHYQHIILHDFLNRIIDESILNDVLTNGCKFFKLTPDDEPIMPIEFSVAAYRFGHSLVRQSYKWNRVIQEMSLRDLFTFTGFRGDLGGSQSLPSNRIIDWRLFYNFDGIEGMINLPPHNVTRRIDTFLAIDLKKLSGFPINTPDYLLSLAVRNLLRGKKMCLPTGQTVAEIIGVQPLTENQIAMGAHKSILEKYGFHQRTPLWYYILKEAEMLMPPNKGVRLGKVGSTIVAETFVGLIGKSKISVLSENDWKPDLGSRSPDKFEMTDLLACVNDINPLG